MADEKKYYCFCGSNCRYETMTKEQILTAIANAIKTGNVGNCDTGFVTKVKEQNSGGCVTFWVGTQAQYNALEEKALNCMYIITDDTTTADMKATFDAAVAAAEESAKAASAAVSGVKPIDITDSITLTNTTRPQNVTDVLIENKKYVYVPAIGAVFFEVDVMIKGSMKANDLFVFEQTGGYDAETVTGLPVQCRGEFFRGEFCNGNELWIIPTQECGGADAWGGTIASGWYFCNGEGV